MTVDDSLRASPELTIGRDGLVIRLTLNRPERRHALTRTLVASLRDAFLAAGQQDGARIVILDGSGPAFCAGADIQEFAQAAADGLAATDANGLVDLFEAIAACPLPVIASVHGAAFGGGVGLVCACDLAIAEAGTRFALSEARLGLIPAVIAPVVIDAIGSREARARMLRASPFAADEALRIGLIHQVAAEGTIGDAVQSSVNDLLLGAPGAQALIKQLPALLRDSRAEELRDITTRILAERLASAEGQEGLMAFTEKRAASWMGGTPK